jgi:hypothetical protein
LNCEQHLLQHLQMQTRSQTKVQQTTPARTEHDIEKRALVIAFHKRGDSLRNVAKETFDSRQTCHV